MTRFVAFMVFFSALISGCDKEQEITTQVMSGDNKGCILKGSPSSDKDGEKAIIKFTSIECPLKDTHVTPVPKGSVIETLPKTLRKINGY